MNIEELKTEHDRIGQCIAENQAELDRVKERLSKTTPQLAEDTDKLEDLRKERQGILLAENDPKTINTAIRKQKENKEVLEDEIIGLEQRLDVLNEQGPSLEKQKLALEQKILVAEKIRPLVDKYNVLAHNMGTILTQLEKNVFTYVVLKTDNSQPPIIVASRGRFGSRWDNSALSSIPSLVVWGDQPQQHIYDRTIVINEIKEAYEARHIRERDIKNLESIAEWTREQTALEEKHESAPCFQCHKYTGLKPVEGERVLACVKFEQGIPEEILSGVITSACGTHA